MPSFFSSREGGWTPHEVKQWILELRERAHTHGNHINRIEGTVAGLQLQVNERFQRIDDEQQNTRQSIDGIRQDISTVRDDMTRQVEAVRGELGAQITMVRGELGSQIKEVDQGLSGDMKELSTAIQDIREKVAKIDVKQAGAVAVAVFIFQQYIGPNLPT